MTKISASLHRRLLPHAVETPGARPAAEISRDLLAACQHLVVRLASEPHFANPVRWFFEEVRADFAIGDQALVRRLIEIHVDLAREMLARLPEPHQRQCEAFTRSGTPCRREAVRGSEFCPSHRHLEWLAATAPEPAGRSDERAPAG